MLRTTPNSTIHKKQARSHQDGKLQRVRQNAITQPSGMPTTTNAFSLSAATKSPCANRCNALVVPQPGQYRPVNAWNRHGGKNVCVAGSMRKSAIHATQAAAAAAVIRPGAGSPVRISQPSFMISPRSLYSCTRSVLPRCVLTVCLPVRAFQEDCTQKLNPTYLYYGFRIFSHQFSLSALPPDWIHPPQQALGAALLQTGDIQGAVSREDLKRLREKVPG
jgi:hypothetical protein